MQVTPLSLVHLSPTIFGQTPVENLSLRAVLIRSHLLPGWVLKRKRRGRRSDFQTSSSFFLSRISALQLAGGSWWSYFEKNKKATVECCERKQRRQFSSAQLQIFFANVYDFYVKLIFRVGRFFVCKTVGTDCKFSSFTSSVKTW